MFKLVAVIFAVINGAPSEQPAGVLTYNQQTFPTLEACMGFAKTEDGMAARRALNAMVATQRGAIVAKLGCAEEEDNTI